MNELKVFIDDEKEEEADKLLIADCFSVARRGNNTKC